MTRPVDERDSDDVSDAEEHDQWLVENQPPHHR